MSNHQHKEGREPLFHLSKRPPIPFWQAWMIRLGAIVLGMAVCALVASLLSEKIQSGNKSIGDLFQAFIDGSFKNADQTKIYLGDAARLLCISLALVPAFRMRFWNIGGEGQTLMGVLSAIAVAFYLGGKVPEGLLLILMLLAALAVGALWAVIPALFRAKWGTNETLFTLMMNYVATFIVGYFLIIWVPSGSSSLGKLKYGKLPVIVNEQLLTVIVVLLLTVGLYIYLNYTKHGYEISVVGESVRTAQYIGINERKVIIRTMILSGALCGLAGYLIAAGADQTVTTNSAGGQGFTGIMVAWLGKFNPLFMIVTAALIQILNQGASQISQDFGVNNALPNVFVGIVLFFIIGSEFFINYEVHFRGHAAKAGRRAIK